MKRTRSCASLLFLQILSHNKTNKQTKQPGHIEINDYIIHQRQISTKDKLPLGEGNLMKIKMTCSKVTFRLWLMLVLLQTSAMNNKNIENQSMYVSVRDIGIGTYTLLRDNQSGIEGRRTDSIWTKIWTEINWPKLWDFYLLHLDQYYSISFYYYLGLNGGIAEPLILLLAYEFRVIHYSFYYIFI